MDEITDAIEGSLSLNAEEWKPGQGYKARSPASSLSGDNSTVARAQEINADQSYQAVDVNGTHYFGMGSSWETSGHHQNTSAALSSPIDNAFHTHTTIPSHQLHKHRTPCRATTRNSIDLPDEEYHYHYYRELSLQSVKEMNPNDPRDKLVPPSFCRAYCLDTQHEHDDPSNANTITQRRSSFGYPTSLFRVTSTTDGNLYCLRRMDSVRCVSHKMCQTVMQQWLCDASGREKNATAGGFDHPGVVRWYKCFLSHRAVYFLHQYHAGAVTLRERFFSCPHGPLPESLIWSCLLQLVSAIRAVHANNLAVRTLQLNHVLCTQQSSLSATSLGPYGLPKLRLRINCVGIVDILEFEARKGLEDLQCIDMRALGCILLSMASGTETNANDIYRNNTVQQQGQMLAEFFRFVQQNYSCEMSVLLHSLLNPNRPPSSIHGIAASVAMRAFNELDNAHESVDEQCNGLMGIYESGRALTLLLKLAFVNERPEFGIDQKWSESGDCYVLRLFRDFVFHQADGAGRPVMDVGHVVSSLNKLDAADEEKIILMPRDGKNILVVSFADVAWCLEKAHQEVCSC